MTWITTIPYEDAEEDLRQTYDRVAGKGQQIDNILMAHSLRPHTLVGHMTLYKSVLHHYGNKIPKSFLEVVGVLVSTLNQCRYCVDHHATGLRRLVNNDALFDAMMEQVSAMVKTSSCDEQVFSPQEQTAMRYAKLLTQTPDLVSAESIDTLRKTGLDDGEILEINQVVAYFCYANRTVLGLGVTTSGEELGLSPGDSDDPENWSHG
ncbi:MAG: peroxidase-related enzyme [Pseudomonadota bacterium]